LLDFNRQATRFHVAGHKLQLIAHYYLVTRDAAYMKEKALGLGKVIDFIVTSREDGKWLVAQGPLARATFACGVSSVPTAPAGAACGHGRRSARPRRNRAGGEARRRSHAYKAAILAAVAKSERHETTPPFIPIPLLADEKAIDPITSTKLGRYYDLMAPYVLGSDVFAGTDARPG